MSVGLEMVRRQVGYGSSDVHKSMERFLPRMQRLAMSDNPTVRRRVHQLAARTARTNEQNRVLRGRAYEVEHRNRALERHYTAEGRVRLGLKTSPVKERRSGMRAVRKSFVNGVWKPASRLGHFERAAVRRGGAHVRPKPKSARGQKLAWNEKPEAPRGKYLVTYDRRPRNRFSRAVTDFRAGLRDGASGGEKHGQAEPRGAGRGGRLHLHRHAMTSRDQANEIAVHELSHMLPKRNTQALARRMEHDPRVYGREEGRADYLAGASDSTLHDEDFALGYLEVQRRMRSAGTRRAGKQQRRIAQRMVGGLPSDQFGKADNSQPLTRMRRDQADKIISQYGTKGPLPGHLGRDEKMKAYEARYVASGGRKGEKWQRRADISDKVKTGGLAGGTAAIGAHFVTRGKLRRAVDTAGLAAAGVGGAGELYAAHSRRKRSTYSNAPAGVAASALRRMRDYTP